MAAATASSDAGNEAAEDAALAHANLIAFSRAVTRWSARGSLEERDDGVILCAGGSPIPMVGNSAFRAGDTVQAEGLLARAAEFYGAMGRGFCVKVRDTGKDDDLRTACEETGLATVGGPVPEMLCRRRLPDLEPPEGIELRLVDDEAGLRDAVAVNGQAYATYGMPPDAMADLFDAPAALLSDGAAHVVVARRAVEPIATAMVYESDGVAGVQWVGTVPDARARGLGALVTTWVTNLAFDRGASSVNLQASPMGEPVYLRLGYETIYHYSEYVRWTGPIPDRPAQAQVRRP
jgi:GNAT superfamily N-acetyltransferase